MADETETKPFDPKKYLVKINGRGDYLEVKWRLLWLRTEHPNAQMETHMVSLGDDQAVFKATVTIPGGGTATGWGSETVGDFRDFLEKAECVPLNSDILTRRGFVGFDEARVGEDVLAYDPAADRCVWTPLREIKVYGQGEVMELRNRAGVALRCTHEHTWAVRGGRMREAIGLCTSDSIVLAAPAPGGDSPLTEEEAAIIAWLFTDGTIKRTGNSLSAAICQSKPATVAVVRELVGGVATESVTPARRMTFPTGRSYDCLAQHWFRLPTAIVRALFAKAGIESDADLPALATRLSAPARAAMLAAMMAADGDKRGNFSKKRRPGVMAAWQVLCTLEGIALSPLRLRANAMPTQRAKKRRHLCVSELDKVPVGPLPVWCPTTDYGTWVMRQDGQVAITGNTKAIGRALAALGYGTQFCTDHDFGADGGWVVDSPTDRRPASGGKPAGNAVPRQASEKQVKFIRALAREANLADEELENWSQELYGLPVAGLSSREASGLIEALRRQANATA
jgi:hypothetical protein